MSAPTVEFRDYVSDKVIRLVVWTLPEFPLKDELISFVDVVGAATVHHIFRREWEVREGDRPRLVVFCTEIPELSEARSE